MDQFIPRVRLKSNQYPTWFSPQLRHQIKCMRILRKKLRNHFTISSLQRLIRMEENFQLELSKAKLNYERSLINNFAYNRDPKIFHYIRDFTLAKSLPPILQCGTSKVESDKEKAEMFNNYFYSIYISSHFILPNMEELAKPTNSISDILLSYEEVYQVLSTLQIKKACGPDGIGPSVLQACASSLTPILHHLFSFSLNNGVVPTEWKLHAITPVFKSGDKSNVKNYRPISLLCNISKALERLVYNKVLDYYSSSISHYQFGFVKTNLHYNSYRGGCRILKRGGHSSCIDNYLCKVHANCVRSTHACEACQI